MTVSSAVPSNRMTGLTALVTGGSRNIGAAVSRRLAEEGARVAIVARTSSEELQKTLSQISDSGGVAEAFVFNIGEKASVETMLDAVQSFFGVPDIVVNCAAIRPRANLEDISEADWDEVHAVNVKAPFWIAKRVIPVMKSRGFGRIVNISGIDAYWGQEGRIHVTTSKGAITGLTRSLAYAVARSGVTVNEVVPGVIDTDRRNTEWYGNDLKKFYARVTEVIPAGRLGTSEEVASAVAFLVSADASYITGHSLTVTGGAYPLARAL